MVTPVNPNEYGESATEAGKKVEQYIADQKWMIALFGLQKMIEQANRGVQSREQRLAESRGLIHREEYRLSHGKLHKEERRRAQTSLHNAKIAMQRYQRYRDESVKSQEFIQKRLDAVKEVEAQQSQKAEQYLANQDYEKASVEFTHFLEQVNFIVKEIKDKSKEYSGYLSTPGMLNKISKLYYINQIEILKKEEQIHLERKKEIEEKLKQSKTAMFREKQNIPKPSATKIDEEPVFHGAQQKMNRQVELKIAFLCQEDWGDMVKSLHTEGSSSNLSQYISVLQDRLSREQSLYDTLHSIAIKHIDIARYGVDFLDKALQKHQLLGVNVKVSDYLPENSNPLTTNILALRDFIENYYQEVLKMAAIILNKKKTDIPLNEAIKISQYTVLHHAARQGNAELLAAVLSAFPENKHRTDYQWNTALFFAAQEGHASAVLFLLKQGLDPTLYNKQGYQASHIADKAGYGKVKTLLEEHVHDKDKLFIACEANDFLTVETLLKKGANPNAKDKVGNTPLHTVAMHNASIKIAQLLIDYDADLNITNSKFQRPLETIPIPSSQQDLAVLFLRARDNAGKQVDDLLIFCEERYVNDYEHSRRNKELLDKAVSKLTAVDIDPLMYQYRWKYLGHLNSLEGTYKDGSVNGKFTGFYCDVFLSLRVRVLFELIILLKTQGSYAQQLPGNFAENIQKLKQELLVELETLAAARDALFTEKQQLSKNLTDAHAQNLAKKIASLSDGDSYCYATGYVDATSPKPSAHAVYVNFLNCAAMDKDRMVVRIDNLGKGSSLHKNKIGSDTHLYPYTFTVLKDYFTMTAIPAYLQDLVVAFVKPESEAFPRVYNKTTSTWGTGFQAIPGTQKTQIEDTAKLKEWWPDKREQTVGNCVAKNHQVGLEIRWLKGDEKCSLYHWFRGAETRHIPTKTYATSKYGAQFPSASGFSKQAMAEAEKEKAALHQLISEEIIELNKPPAKETNAATQTEIAERLITLKAIQKDLAQVIDPVKEAEQAGYSDLHLAALSGDSTKVQQCIDAGADLQAKTRNGYTALHLASLYGFSEITDQLSKINPKLLDIATDHGDLPLYLAVAQEHTETVTHLVQQSVNISMNHAQDQIVLDLAKTASPEMREVISVSQKSESTHQTESNSEFQGLKLHRVPGDGHCLFHAIGYHLNLNQNADYLRQIIAAHMEHNIAHFQNYRPGTETDFRQYINDIRQGKEWGDHIEIEVIQRLLNRPIIIIRPNTNPTIPDNVKKYKEDPIFVYYDGIHYDTFEIEKGYNAKKILVNIQTQIEQGQLVTYNSFIPLIQKTLAFSICDNKIQRGQEAILTPAQLLKDTPLLLAKYSNPLQKYLLRNLYDALMLVQNGMAATDIQSEICREPMKFNAAMDPIEQYLLAIEKIIEPALAIERLEKKLRQQEEMWCAHLTKTQGNLDNLAADDARLKVQVAQPVVISSAASLLTTGKILNSPLSVTVNSESTTAASVVTKSAIKDIHIPKPQESAPLPSNELASSRLFRRAQQKILDVEKTASSSQPSFRRIN